MKLTIGQKNLKRALGLVEKIVSKNTSLPILNNILLKTENGRLKISATNLELGINTTIGVKIDEVGEIAVPARIFSDFVSAIQDEKVSLSTKNNILNVNTDNFKTKILGFDPKDFPIIPKVNSDSAVIIASNLLKNSLLKVVDSMAISETRPELAGVLFKTENNSIILVSTDIFRLTEVKIQGKSSQEVSFILPRNTVAELIRMTWEISGDIRINYVDNQVSFVAEDIELVSRVIDGIYPPYKNVIPDKFLSRVLIKKDALENGIRLAGLFSSHISDIKVSCAKDKLTIMAQNSEKGELETEVGANLKNEPFELVLNYRYFLDGLKNMPSNEVILEFTGAGSPFVVKPSDDKTLVYLIMPLRS